MHNPWEKIDLEIYEEHMKSDSVKQLQLLSKITKEQIFEYDHSVITILGIAGGNGLEHIDIDSTDKIIGYDINQKYLDICQSRYSRFRDKLVLQYSS